MNSLKTIFYFTQLLFCLLAGNTAFAQGKTSKSSLSPTGLASKQKTDSLNEIRKYKSSNQNKDSVSNIRQEKINALREARVRYFDSIKAFRKEVLDSTIDARKKISDAIKTRQKNRTDSLAIIGKYRESKRYKDSILMMRNTRIDSIRNIRIHYFDSVKTIRKKALDSTVAIRKKVTDSIKAKQKIRTDSLTVIRKHKESKRYRDSVTVMRQSRLDSIKTMRKIYSDNIVSTRKKSLDSLTKIRKERLDSLTKARKIRTDSLQNAKDLRADSLAKKKELREKQVKAEQKKREEKLKIQFELKIKKKHQAWSNEKMLKKRWSLVRRSFQNMLTRYNYYFNARLKMQEAGRNMQRRKKDNFEELIDLFPFDPNIDSTVFASDMDTIIRKASVGLQIHDPRSKWADDLYLLMGEAYYFKGDYEKADASFKYIIGMNKALKLKKKKEVDNGLVKKEKSKLSRLLMHQPAQNDAVLWLTRMYADSKKEAEAEAILDLIDASSKLSENMKAKLALERANLLIKSKDYREASKQLSAVVPSKAISKYTRQRASFLNGQLQFELGQYDSASKSFRTNLSLHPPIEMDFYAHKYRADAVAQSGGDPTKTLASLKRLLKDGKYTPYHEQVYSILGKLSANEGKNEEALDYYNKSIRQPKTTPKQKAISFASMGNIQYKTGQFNLAKKSYDSASYFARFAKGNPEVELAIRRGQSLDKIEEPYHSLHNNDSLLKLSKMSEKEQKAVVKKYLKYLEKQKEDSVTNALQAATAGSLGSGTSTGESSSWYFGSTVAVQQGYNEFKRKWGNRPLADNWRRASSSSLGASLESSNESEEDTSEQDSELNEEGLLAAIPKSDIQINSVEKKIKRAYINLARTYVKDLEEFQEGLNALDSLDRRFPNHEYPDEVLSIKYTAALRQGKLELAESIRQQLLNTYPKSNFSIALRPIDNADTIGSSALKTEDVALYYESTYQLASDHEYKEVIQRVAVAKRVYGDQTYSRKFRVLEAQSFASIGNYKKADTLVTEYVKEFPSDSLRPWIDAIMKNVADQKAADTLGVDSTKSTSATKAIDSLAKSNANDTLGKSTIPSSYTYNSKEAHFCVFVFGKPDAKVSGFRSGMTDFSAIKFSGITLSSEIEMLNADRAMVITKTFGNSGEAKIFMNGTQKEKLLFREFEADSYQYFIISEQNFMRLKAEKKVDNYLNFYKKNYK